MEYYCKRSHTVYDIKLHIVWNRKYRKPVLSGDAAIRYRDPIVEVCKSWMWRSSGSKPQGTIVMF